MESVEVAKNFNTGDSDTLKQMILQKTPSDDKSDEESKDNGSDNPYIPKIEPESPVETFVIEEDEDQKYEMEESQEFKNKYLADIADEKEEPKQQPVAPLQEDKGDSDEEEEDDEAYLTKLEQEAEKD